MHMMAAWCFDGMMALTVAAVHRTNSKSVWANRTISDGRPCEKRNAAAAGFNTVSRRLLLPAAVHLVRLHAKLYAACTELSQLARAAHATTTQTAHTTHATPSRSLQLNALCSAAQTFTGADYDCEFERFIGVEPAGFDAERIGIIRNIVFYRAMDLKLKKNTEKSRPLASFL